MSIKVSIIVPVYNVEMYIRECLDSILSQTYAKRGDVELICVNDGSTDSSLDILKEYSLKTSYLQSIEVLTKENGGLSSARNCGLQRATGDLVMFVDSDDFIEKDTVESVVKAYEETNADCIVYSMEPFSEDADTSTLEDVKNYCSLKFEGSQIFSLDKAFNTNIHVVNKAYKLDIIKQMNLQFVEGYLYEDIYFTLKYLLFNRRLFYLHKKGYNYRVRKDSIMGDSASNKSISKALFHLLNWHKVAFEIAEDPQLLMENFDLLTMLLKTLWKSTLNLSDSKDSFVITEVYNTYKTSIQSLYNTEYNRRHNANK